MSEVNTKPAAENAEGEAAEQTEQDINILKKIRMDKLEEMKAEGRDPFQITKFDVTAHAAEAKEQYEALEQKLTEQAGGDEEKLKEPARGKQDNRKCGGQSNVTQTYGQGELFRSARQI